MPNQLTTDQPTGLTFQVPTLNMGPLAVTVGGSSSFAPSTPTLIAPQLGQLAPVGRPLNVQAIVPVGSAPIMQLGSNLPLPMSVVGNIATGTLLPGAGDVGVAVPVSVTVGGAVISTTVDVEANVIYWVNASDPASYTASGTNLSSIVNLISNVAAATKVGAPQLLVDPRTNKPSFYFDLTNYFTGTDPAVLAAAAGADLPFTYIIVCSGSLATANFVAFAQMLSTNVGGGRQFGMSGGKWFFQIFNSPAGPAHSVLSENVTAGISVVVMHSSNSLTVFTGVNGGSESSGVTASAGAIAPDRVGFAISPSAAPSFPFSGTIYEIIGFGVNKSAASIAAMADRCVRFWRAKAPQVVFIGDSITTAQLATNGGMPALLAGAVTAAGGVVDPDGPLAIGQPIPIRHSAASGNTPVDMNTRITDATDGLGTVGGGTGSNGYYSRAILACLFAGTNPTGAGTDAQKALQTSLDYTSLLNNIATRLAQGSANWRIAVTTITPEAAQVYPSLFNAYLGPIWDAFDAAHPSNKLLRWDAYNALPFDASLYVDATHPNNAGYIKMCNAPTNGLFQAVLPFILSVQPAT